MILKNGSSAVSHIVENAYISAFDIDLSSDDIRKWHESMVAVECLCDPVKRLFKVQREFFKDRLIDVDGGTLSSEPWLPLAEIEKKLFPNLKDLFFTEKRFYQGNDGHYCLVRNSGTLICLPKSKSELLVVEESFSY